MLQIGHKLQFHCQGCDSSITFSVLDCEENVCCPQCKKKYLFDEGLLSHLRKFEALCRQIHASQEILGTTHIAIDVGTTRVKVPFNILLTRLSSVIDLNINGEPCSISFRLEPIRDVAEIL